MAASVDSEECQSDTYKIGGDSLDSNLDWAPRKKKKMSETESGKVETFLCSTTSSENSADHWRLKLETLETRIVEGEEWLETQRQQFE